MSDTAQSMKLDVAAYMRGLGETAREAARLLGRAETAAKNTALLAIADAIVAERERLRAPGDRWQRNLCHWQNLLL